MSGSIGGIRGGAVGVASPVNMNLEVLKNYIRLNGLTNAVKIDDSEKRITITAMSALVGHKSALIQRLGPLGESYGIKGGDIKAYLPITFANLGRVFNTSRPQSGVSTSGAASGKATAGVVSSGPVFTPVSTAPVDESSSYSEKSAVSKSEDRGENKRSSPDLLGKNYSVYPARNRKHEEG